jgi:uracil-DNA glycosylase
MISLKGQIAAMMARSHLNPHTAARALAEWWALAGVEPPDLDNALRAAKSQAQVPGGLRDTATPPLSRQAAARPGAAPKRALDVVAEAHAIAAACTSLDALEKAIEAFDGCPLKANARQAVFSDGVRGAPIMIVGEAPGRDEEDAGKPFVGVSGQLLDKMLASIGLSRATNCYITNLVNWRPPGNRTPTQDEIAVSKPFARRHIELAQPKVLLLVGGISAQSLLERNEGIMKLRKSEFSFSINGVGGENIYTQVLIHPAYLLRRPGEKALAWQDLLRFKAQISALDVAF